MYQLEIIIKDLPDSIENFKAKALLWASSFAQVAFYEPNNISFPHQGFLNFLAVSNNFLEIDINEALASLQKEVNQSKEVLCCILSYELKNQIESLSSSNPNAIQFPVIHFFYPDIQVVFKKTTVYIYSNQDNCSQILENILAQNIELEYSQSNVKIQSRTTKAEYIEQVNQIKQRIWEGDVYELNFCQEFYADVQEFNPVATFIKLNQLSPMPFAGYYKIHNHHLLCASPERFLKKTQNQLIAQPIKGTIRRGKTSLEDSELKQALANNEKEVAENMMIMDLVRNDLARCSITGSIKVEEMFGIYTFQQVHQMITTIKSQVSTETTISDILKSLFPMGSMTGAPKIAAMQLIEQYENFARGLYAGSLGYILPNGDFDFNVVIRSIQFNALQNKISFAVGSAITFDSDPEKEYEECLLKASAIMQVLKSI